MTVKSRIKLKLFIRLIPGYAIFFISIFMIGALYSLIAGSAIGMPILFISFISLRYRYKDNITYHNMSTKKCIALSIALFAVSAFPLIVLNTKIGLLSSIPIAIGMTWFLYVLGLKDKAERELEESKKDTFNLDTCTEEELRERCRKRFKRDVEYKTERAIKHFILKLPHEQIDVNVEQSKKERYRMRKLLE